MAELGRVKVLGCWYSPYSRRVEIALKLKGVVDYEYIEEDLKDKSPLLLESNPVHKKVPVLIHNRKPIAESLNILEYIDETWNSSNSNQRLMPTDPYERAQARFWSKFIDEKIRLRNLIFEGGDRQKEEQETIESLKALENQLKGKKFFGGENIGIVDLAGINVALWAPAVQEAAGKCVVTWESFPLLTNWADTLLSCSIVQQNLPSKESLVTLYRARISEAAAAKN